MRLTSLYIGQYKNLRDFSLSFDGGSFIDVFVGKNGTGKSNLFEALIEIFRHLDQLGHADNKISFDYKLSYEIDGQGIEIEWKKGELRINKGKDRKGLGQTPFPDNVLIYYSGHNRAVFDLMNRYEESFRRRIRGANLEDSRRFIGIGPEYKSLLLAVLLSQPKTNKAKLFIEDKLGVASIGDELIVEFKRPVFANGRMKELNVDGIEDFDSRTHFWGADGITRNFLYKLIDCIKGEFNHSDIYRRDKDKYRLKINLALFQKRFKGDLASDLFRQLDNLKTLGMLDEITVPLKLKSGEEATIAHFSDGQFQSIYIFSIVELFKDRNCITLLDEPDAFLHPEWQFDFLKQIFEITDTAARNNHMLMSSHSAVTLIPHDKKKIKFFDIKNNQANCYDLPKSIAIKKLSADLIRYSEQGTLLSILNTIQIENKPVLFTEGSTDPIILTEAWEKMYEEEIPFIPFYAFSCTYIKQLLTDNRIHAEMDGLPVFALFDFDKAYDQWNGLNGDVTENDPIKGMIKKWADGESYALMLPVPTNHDIQKQVISDAATGKTFGSDSCCEIEHLFYGIDATKNYYQQEPCVGGTKIVFKSDGAKTSFAKEVVPKLDPGCFEVFRPMFEFIKSKCTPDAVPH